MAYPPYELLPPGTVGNMVGGGVNGFLQTGDVKGFTRGLLAGAIPQDLGFTDAFKNNPAANIGIGVARDGIRGAIVADSRDGIMPGIAYGQLNNAAGHLVGFATTGNAPTFVKGAGVFVYTDKQVGGFWEQRGALTVGNVISGPSDLMTRTTDTGISVYAHELDHFQNPVEKSLGATYGVAHILDLAVGNLGYKLGQRANWFILEEHVQRYPYSSMGLYR